MQLNKIGDPKINDGIKTIQNDRKIWNQRKIKIYSNVKANGWKRKEKFLAFYEKIFNPFPKIF